MIFLSLRSYYKGSFRLWILEFSIVSREDPALEEDGWARPPVRRDSDRQSTAFRRLWTMRPPRGRKKASSKDGFDPSESPPCRTRQMRNLRYPNLPGLFHRLMSRRCGEYR
jgi:hypothetical protein